MKVMVGTSGYSYDDWRNVFYPGDLPRGKMLDFYSGYFKGVEINSTYYHIPHHAVFQRFSEKTPPDFEFVIKLNRANTHERNHSRPALNQLMEAVKPLIDNRKFSGFLAQFPYSFKNSPPNRDFIRELKSQMGDLTLFVEFRNWTWDRPETYHLLEENTIHYVNVDEPPLKGLLKPQDMVSGNVGYVRFHGRNSGNWWEGDNQSRYDYLYSSSELDEWLTRLSRILKKAHKTYIFFNNHPQGKAVQNANMLNDMLESYLAGM